MPSRRPTGRIWVDGYVTKLTKYVDSLWIYGTRPPRVLQHFLLYTINIFISFYFNKPILQLKKMIGK